MAYLWLWISIAADAASDLFSKEGTIVLGEAPKAASEATIWFLKLLINPYVVAALLCVVLGAITFTIAMSRLKLSYLVPISSAMIPVVVAIFSLVLFEEVITGPGWLGLVIICVGVFVVSREKGSSDII